MSKTDRLGIVLVTYGEGKKINHLLDVISKEKKPGDRVALIDNHPANQTAAVAQKHPAVDVVLKNRGNTGYAVGNVIAAKAIEKEVDLLLFLNPDCRPEEGAITKLRQNAPNDWSAWMGLLVLDDGKRINSSGGVVHISGLSWVNGFGKDASEFTEPSEVVVVSGAAFVVRKSVWKKINRFPSIYYIYYEDTELSLDIKMLGQKVGIMPSAKVRHSYNFYNSPRKWYLLERNRYIFIIRTWPLGVILVLLPMLLLCEIGLWGISIIQRRFLLKVRSTFGAIKALPAAYRGRREVQSRRKISTLEFYDFLEPRINTELLPKVMRSAPVNGLFIAYYHFARFVLRILNHQMD